MRVGGSGGGSGRFCSAEYKPMCRTVSKTHAVKSILLFSVQYKFWYFTCNQLLYSTCVTRYRLSHHQRSTVTFHSSAIDGI